MTTYYIGDDFLLCDRTGQITRFTLEEHMVPGLNSYLNPVGPINIYPYKFRLVTPVVSEHGPVITREIPRGAQLPTDSNQRFLTPEEFLHLHPRSGRFSVAIFPDRRLSTEGSYLILIGSHERIQDVFLRMRLSFPEWRNAVVAASVSSEVQKVLINLRMYREASIIRDE
jgi:hypothetical protein